MANIRAQVGNRIRELRKERGWSQEALAGHARLHPTYIGGIERGERNVSLMNLARISEALHLSMAKLLDFPVEDPRVADVRHLVAGDDPLGLMFYSTFCKPCPHLESFRQFQAFHAASTPSPPTPRKSE
jgi:transcriptional regulator with XRE-family HTH domain